MNNLEPLQVKRKRQRFTPDASRVITRFFGPGGRERQQKIIRRIISLADEKAKDILEAVMRDFSDRHLDLTTALLRHYSMIEDLIEKPESPDNNRKLLIGAFFTKEYSIESVSSLTNDPNIRKTAKGRGSIFRCPRFFKGAYELLWAG